MRAAIYCRISQDRDGEGLGVERQLEDCQAVASRKGWHVVGTYIDNHVSASAFSKKARVRYLDLLDDIEAGQIDAVVMWAEDRTHRQVLELAEFINLCTKHNVKVATIGTEYDLDDPDEKSMWFIKIRLAEAEVEKTSKRLRRQRLQTAMKGQPHPSGTRHFGLPGKGVPLATVLLEQDCVRQALERIIAGDSVRSIVQDWNERGITTSQGKQWSRHGLRMLVTSPSIAGYRVHQGEILLDGDGKPVATTWAPIVDRADWQAVRDILADPSRHTVRRGRGPSYLLTGFIFCGVCGERMRAHNTKQDGNPYYTCENFGPNAPKPRLARLVKNVDGEVAKRVLRALTSPKLDDAMAHDKPEDPTRAISADLARLQARLDRLDDDETVASADGDDRKVRSIRRVKVATERDMNALRARLAALTGNRVRAHVPHNLAQVWPDLSLDRRRAIIAAVADGVVILPQQAPAVFDPTAIVVAWRDRTVDPPELTALPWWAHRRF